MNLVPRKTGPGRTPGAISLLDEMVTVTAPEDKR
jgi:hypothetical protein